MAGATAAFCSRVGGATVVIGASLLRSVHEDKEGRQGLRHDSVPKGGRVLTERGRGCGGRMKIETWCRPRE
jgi:hypothetical protein